MEKKPTNFDYKKVAYEYIVCNLCGANNFKVLSRKDRYGLAVRTVICKQCGLIYLNPRMSAADYRHFYEKAYREQLRAYKGGEIDLDKLFESSRRWGQKFIETLKTYLYPGLTIEIGSSVGGILSAIRDLNIASEVLGVEPSSVEARYAETKGIPTRIGLFEEINQELPRAKNIIIARSLNHLLDPCQFIIWSHHLLDAKGTLVIVVLNFEASCLRRGILKTQIDHPYMFTPQTLTSLVKSGGFEIKYLNCEGDYIYLAAAKKDTIPFNDLILDSSAYTTTVRTLKFYKLWLRRIYEKILRILLKCVF